MDGLRSAKDDCPLRDLGYMGNMFTWKRGLTEETMLKEWLDRFLGGDLHSLAGIEADLAHMCISSNVELLVSDLIDHEHGVWREDVLDEVLLKEDANLIRDIPLVPCIQQVGGPGHQQRCGKSTAIIEGVGVGFGVVVRGSDGELVAVVLRRVKARWSANMAEAIDAYYGMQILCGLEARKVWLESDALGVLMAVNGHGHGRSLGGREGGGITVAHMAARFAALNGERKTEWRITVSVLLRVVIDLSSICVVRNYTSCDRTHLQETKQSVNYTLVLEIQLVLSLSATVLCTIGMFASGEYKVYAKEMEAYELGKRMYIFVLICNAIVWQLFYLGTTGVIYYGSSLFSGVIIALALPITEMGAIIFFHEQFLSEKGVSLVLSLWGFVSYFYGEVRHMNKQKKKEKEGTIGSIDIESPSP
ncbi:Purine permease 3 [Bienertia sinuspersici]